MQQHAAFVTFSHAILFTQKIENQTFTQSTHFTNLDKTVFQLIEIDVGTKCPGVTDTYSIYTKLVIKLSLKAYRWRKDIYPIILSLGTG